MSEEVALELAEMDKILESLGEPPQEEAPKEEPPKEEPKGEEPKEDNQETPPPTEEEAPSEETHAEEPPTAVDPRDEKISALEAKLAELAAKLDKPTESPQQVEPEVTDQDFVGDTDIEELVQDPKEFNKFMNKIYHKAMIDSRTALAKQLPAMVQQQAQAVVAMQKMSDNFYKANSDLVKFPKVVQAVSEEILSANPDITIEGLTSRLAVEARKRLNLPDPKKVPAPKPAALPKVGKRAGTPDSAPKSNTFQNELEDMEKALNS